MAKKFFYKVYYRAAGTIVTTLTKGGTYPEYTFSGWTAMPGLAAEAAKMSPELDGSEAMGDGTEYATGEKTVNEVKLVGWTAANYASIRSALLNVKVDLLLVDPDQYATAYAAFGVRLYPNVTLEGGAEPTIVLKGDRKYGAGLSAATVPFQMITVT